MSGACTKKELSTKSQRKTIVNDFCRGRQYEQFKGHLLLDFLANNVNKDVPIWGYFRFIHALHFLPAVLKFIFVADNCQPSSKSGYWSSTITYLK